jgi:hypothetical protein
MQILVSSSTRSGIATGMGTADARRKPKVVSVPLSVARSRRRLTADDSERSEYRLKLHVFVVGKIWCVRL